MEPPASATKVAPVEAVWVVEVEDGFSGVGGFDEGEVDRDRRLAVLAFELLVADVDPFVGEVCKESLSRLSKGASTGV